MYAAVPLVAGIFLGIFLEYVRLKEMWKGRGNEVVPLCKCSLDVRAGFCLDIGQLDFKQINKYPYIKSK